MERLTKALVGTVAAGAMAVSAAAPAQARDNDGIGAGEIIAGALVIGGIAAIASSASKDNDRYRYGSRYRYDDRRYDRRGYRGGRYASPRDAVAQCVRAVESAASRYGHGRANVTQIRKVKRTGKGYDVKGRLAVNDAGRYGYRNSRYRGGYDTGTFKCNYNYGRVVDVDFSGIRGLR
ncbi:hypothetical protein B2G71_14525 [Novosphingobium sp. PC22D]|uniref:hypothetical protein n=1 Tax=Novosphingobium sp. PC22D TaxID=1962403 RepID=UPI000BF01B48|nr:hypothetical protein [Novosphingobium sp. PC22D]PEQ11992.1 hypothetical protein B2G71_14525 [Novosphingobium sp. PC22D]